MEKMLREKTFSWLLVGAWDGLSWETTAESLMASALSVSGTIGSSGYEFPSSLCRGRRILGSEVWGQLGGQIWPLVWALRISLCLRLPSDQGKFQIIDKMQIKGWHYPCQSVPSHSKPFVYCSDSCFGPGEGQQGSSKTMWSLLNLSLPLALAAESPAWAGPGSQSPQLLAGLPTLAPLQPSLAWLTGPEIHVLSYAAFLGLSSAILLYISRKQKTISLHLLESLFLSWVMWSTCCSARQYRTVIISLR